MRVHEKMSKIAFVTTFCPHHRVRTFELLAKYHDVQYFFFSAGDEWYWQQQHGVQNGDFSYAYLPGVRLGRTRLTPTLPVKLWQGNYDLYIKCINGRFALPITYMVARLRRKPFVLWTGIWTRIQTKAHRWFFPVTRYVYRHSDAVIVYGEHVKRYLISEGVKAEKIFVAAHAVDNVSYSRNVEEESLKLRLQLNINERQKVILYLGRLEEIKGLEYLLEAYSTLRILDETVLILAGTGSEEEKLREYAKALGISEMVRFVGYAPVEQAIHYYALAAVCVLPSVSLPIGKETWGLVINEAMNQGVPVIATDAVGAAAGGLVQEGVNGFIVPERNSSALSHALLRILDDDQLREQMSQNAKNIVAEWDNEHMVLGFRQAIAFATKSAL